MLAIIQSIQASRYTFALLRNLHQTKTVASLRERMLATSILFEELKRNG